MQRTNVYETHKIEKRIKHKIYKINKKIKRNKNMKIYYVATLL